MTELSPFIDKIWRSERLDLSNVIRGKNFLLSLKSDLEFIRELSLRFGLSLDKNDFVSGTELVPLTVLVIADKGEIPGKETFVGKPSYRIVYFGFSPELENFVSIVLWPSHKSEETLKRILEEISEATIVLNLEGNYRLRLPNEIHPFRASKISLKNVRVTDWKYLPYVKEVGDTLFTKVSPLNFRKVYLSSGIGGYEAKYINIKTCVGIVKKIQSKEIMLKIPYLDQKTIKRKYIAKYHDRIGRKITTQIAKGDKVAILIIEEINSGDENGHIPEHLIFDIEKVDTAYILGHMLSFFLYNLHLLKEKLELMNNKEFEILFSNLLQICYSFCKKIDDTSPQILENKELIFYGLLSPFFEIHEDKIYYIPSYLKTEIKELPFLLSYIDEKLIGSENTRFEDIYCLHKEFKILEESLKRSDSLIKCPKYQKQIRKGAKICENCEFHHSTQKGKLIQQCFKLLNFSFKIKSKIYLDRLIKFGEIVEKLGF